MMCHHPLGVVGEQDVIDVGLDGTRFRGVARVDQHFDRRGPVREQIAGVIRVYVQHEGRTSIIQQRADLAIVLQARHQMEGGVGGETRHQIARQITGIFVIDCVRNARQVEIDRIAEYDQWNQRRRQQHHAGFLHSLEAGQLQTQHRQPAHHERLLRKALRMAGRPNTSVSSTKPTPFHHSTMPMRPASNSVSRPCMPKRAAMRSVKGRIAAGME